MKTIKKICLILTILSCTIQQKDLSAGTIAMIMYLDEHFPLANSRSQPLMLQTNVIMRGFKNDQVALVSKKHAIGSFRAFKYDDGEYLPEQLQAALMDGSVDEYPLDFHRKFNYVNEDDELIVYACHAAGALKELNLNTEIRARLLLFLTQDFEDQDQSSNHSFLEALFPRINFDKPFVSQSLQEEDITIGDPIALCGKHPTLLFHVHCMHFCIALGNGLYLSNCRMETAEGKTYAYLCVVPMESLLRCSKAEKFARIIDKIK